MQPFTRDFKDSQRCANATGRWSAGIYHQFQQHASSDAGIFVLHIRRDRSACSPVSTRATISQPPWLGRCSPPAAGHAMAVLDALWPTPWQPCIGDGGSAFSAPRQQANCSSSTPLAAALKSARIHTFGLRGPLHLSNECGAENTP
jgi:hypothetical protein